MCYTMCMIPLHSQSNHTIRPIQARKDRVMRMPRRSLLLCNAVIAVVLLAWAFATYADKPEPSPAPPQPADSTTASGHIHKDGLILKTDAAFAGYTLFAPLTSTTTYLIDLQGRVVHSWPSKYTPGQSAYLLDDGSLLRCAREPANRHFEGGGIGGRLERIAVDGKLLWEYVCADGHRCQHHDIRPMPNGHVLLIAWEKKTPRTGCRRRLRSLRVERRRDLA